MLVTHSQSSLWFRSIFSSDKAESGNKLDRGRKLGRWGREKMREGKKKRSIRKFNKIGTNRICFSVSPTSTCNQVRKDTHTHTHASASNSQQALASTSTRCRSHGALVISIQHIQSLPCLRRKCIHLQFRHTPIQSYRLPMNIVRV